MLFTFDFVFFKKNTLNIIHYKSTSLQAPNFSTRNFLVAS